MNTRCSGLVGGLPRAGRGDTTFLEQERGQVAGYRALGEAAGLQGEEPFAPGHRGIDDCVASCGK